MLRNCRVISSEVLRIQQELNNINIPQIDNDQEAMDGGFYLSCCHGWLSVEKRPWEFTGSPKNHHCWLVRRILVGGLGFARKAFEKIRGLTTTPTKQLIIN